MAAIIGGFALVLVGVYLLDRRILSGHSLFVLLALAIPLTFLTRYDIGFAVWLGGRPYWGLFGVMAIVAAVGVAWACLRPGGPGGAAVGRMLALAGPFLAAVAVGSAILWARGQQPHSLWKGWAHTAQAVVLFGLPLASGCSVMLAARPDEGGLERYLFAFGLFTLAVAAVCLVTAVARADVARLVLGPVERARAPFWRAFSPIGSPVPNAVVLYLGAALALSRAVSSKRKQAFYVVVAAAATLGIIACLSRSVVLVWGGTALWLLRRGGGRARKLVVAAVLLALAVCMAVTFDVSRLVSIQDGSIAARATSLRAGLRLFLERPVFGWGFGQTYDALWQRSAETTIGVGQEMTVVRDMATLREPHNTYLMVLAETGLVGLAGFGWLLWGIYRLLSPPADAGRLERPAMLEGFRVMYLGFVALSLTVSHMVMHHRVAWIFWVFVATGAAYRRTVVEGPAAGGRRPAPPQTRARVAPSPLPGGRPEEA